MAQLNPYLSFDGNAAEAFAFYQSVFGGELTIQTVGESPIAATLPDQAESIMHATLTVDGRALLSGSDMVGPNGVTMGNAVALLLTCESDEEIARIFTKISAGGEANSPLKEEFWGAIFGDVTDKFGFRWMLNFQKPKSAIATHQ